MPLHRAETPFDNIESSLEFVSLLGDAVREALEEIETDVETARADEAARRLEALQLVHFKLSRLHSHINSSHHILNDLRTLRRLLLEERTLDRAARRAEA